MGLLELLSILEVFLCWITILDLLEVKFEFSNFTLWLISDFLWLAAKYEGGAFDIKLTLCKVLVLDLLLIDFSGVLEKVVLDLDLDLDFERALDYTEGCSFDFDFIVDLFLEFDFDLDFDLATLLNNLLLILF